MTDFRKNDQPDKKTTKINLKDKKIKDSDNIFAELLTLPELLEIDLSGNLLTFIPTDFSKLKKIQALDITNNPFSNVSISIIIKKINKNILLFLV